MLTSIKKFVSIVLKGNKMGLKKEKETHIDFSAFAGKWVALSHDESMVISSSVKLSTTMDKAHKMGELNPVVTKIPKKYGSGYLL